MVNKDKRGKNRPYILTEFRGYKVKIKDHSFMKDEESGHYSFQDTDTMNEALKVFIKNNAKSMAVTMLFDCCCY